MSDWQPQLVRIEKLEKHPFADVLDIATVLGDYPVIVKRDQFKAGELAQYIPIDTIVPDTHTFYFLSPKAFKEEDAIKETDTPTPYQYEIGKKYRVGHVPERYRIIKAKKLREICSQGLLIGQFEGYLDGDPRPVNVGDSIVEYLGLKKWEEQEEDNIPNAKK